MKKNLKNSGEPLAALPLFRLVARVGSFTAAADHLGISASAVSQQIRGLEQRLDVRLFNRTSRAVTLSEAGTRLLADIGPALEHIDLSLQALRAQRSAPAGLLRINTSRLAAGLLITPRMDAFLARYPEIRLELFTDDTFADIVRDGFDAGIRLGDFVVRDMVALPLDRGQWQAVVASPAYLREHGTPRVPDDLRNHDCIHFRMPGSGRLAPWIFRMEGEEREVPVKGRLIFTDDTLITRAAIAGHGIAHRFVDTVATELQDGQLVQVLADYERPWGGFHIYYPARERMAPKLRVFIDFLREPLLAAQASSHGQPGDAALQVEPQHE